MDREELRAIIAKAESNACVRGEEGGPKAFADAILTALDEAGVQCLRWRPIEDAGSTAQKMLVTSRLYDYRAVAKKDALGVWRLCGNAGGEPVLNWEPTHFMPLPSHPKEHS